MATYYLDYVSGDDAANGTSEGTPKKTLTSLSYSIGDTILLKRGVTHVIDAAFGFSISRATSASGLWTTLGAYGSSASSPYAILDNINSSGPTINISGSATNRFNVRIQDLWIKASGHTGNAILAHSNAGDLTNVEFLRCKIDGIRNTGLKIQSDNADLYTIRNVLVSKCALSGNTSHGSLVSGQADSIYFRKCVSYGNGIADGAHGFSSYGQRADISSWTGTSGVCTKSGLTYTDVYYVSTTNTTYPILTKVASATNPGEFSYSGGVLSININGNPASFTITACYGLMNNIQYSECISFGNNAYSGYAFHEGAGFQFDDFTQNSKFSACVSYGNDGNGFLINRGSGNSIVGCVAYNNGWPGIGVNRARSTIVRNNTLYKNNAFLTDAGFSNTADGEIFVGSGATGCEISNNIIVGPNRTYAISIDTTSTGATVQKNNSFSQTGAACNGATESGGIAVDPMLSLGWYPGNASLRNVGTALGGLDFYGKEFSATPNIGAVEDWPSRSVVARSSASRSTAIRSTAVRRATAGA